MNKCICYRLFVYMLSPVSKSHIHKQNNVENAWACICVKNNGVYVWKIMFLFPIVIYCCRVGDTIFSPILFYERNTLGTISEKVKNRNREQNVGNENRELLYSSCVIWSNWMCYILVFICNRNWTQKSIRGTSKLREVTQLVGEKLWEWNVLSNTDTIYGSIYRIVRLISEAEYRNKYSKQSGILPYMIMHKYNLV